MYYPPPRVSILEDEPEEEYLGYEPSEYRVVYAPRKQQASPWLTLLWILLAAFLLWLLYRWWTSSKSAPAPVPEPTPTPIPGPIPPSPTPFPGPAPVPAPAPEPRPASAVQITASVQPKTPCHVWYGMGNPLGISVDAGAGAVQSGTLNLRRGIPYRILYNNPDFPIYFTTSNIGNSNGIGQLEGTPGPFTTDTTLVFDSRHPSSFFYQASNGQYMGGQVNLS